MLILYVIGYCIGGALEILGLYLTALGRWISRTRVVANGGIFHHPAFGYLTPGFPALPHATAEEAFTAIRYQLARLEQEELDRAASGSTHDDR